MKPETQRLLQDLIDMEKNIGRNLTDNPDISDASARYLEVERELFNRAINYIKTNEDAADKSEKQIPEVPIRERIDPNSSKILDKYNKILDSINTKK